MFNFVEDKLVDWENVKRLLQLSVTSGQWSNFGPVSQLLEQHISNVVGGDRAVVVTSSGTAALYAIVHMHSFLRNRPLKWVVSAYTFACQKMGALADANVVDCDENGMLDLDALDGIDYDGMVVTNIFGTSSDLSRYVQFCQDNDKILITDAAMSYDTRREVFTDEIISFHHTKPWGIGEGGCVIINKEYENLIRSIINFGSCYDPKLIRYSSNGKMSDPSAAFILDRLLKMKEITDEHRRQYQRVSHLAGIIDIPTAFGEPTGTPVFVPLMHCKPVVNLNNDIVTLRKYYKPLVDLSKSKHLYDHIICVPCHPGISDISDESIVAALKYVCSF